MSDRNCLSAGEYFVPLPIGFPLKLVYDENGVLTKICKGYQEKGEDVSSIFLYPMINLHIVPNKVALKNGTTNVTGFLYTDKKLEGEGKLPECKYDSIIKLFKSDANGFRFFAISVNSSSAVFRGAMTIRQWLTFSKFNVPKGVLLDNKTSGYEDRYLFDHENDNTWKNINFKFPKIPQYALFSTDGVKYGDFDIFENTVKSADRKVFESGVIDCEIKFKSVKDKMSVPYSEVVKYNIQKNTVLVYDRYLNILSSEYTQNNNVISDTIMCSTCGKIIHVPKSGVTMCSDVNCNSRLYPRIKQFLTTLHLPYVSYDRYQEICQYKGLHFHVPDILNIEEFEDTKLKCTVFEILRALTPKYIMLDDNILLQFCNTCKNSSETVQYYLQFPADIQIDISSFIEKNMRSVVDWYANPDNIQDLISVFHSDKIELISENIEFKGAPIFRNTNFVLTGKFIHGNYDLIKSILRGYGGTVQQEVSNYTDCIIVGDMLENISGHTIKEGRKYNIPIINEFEFFNRYDIDSDMRENL